MVQTVNGEISADKLGNTLSHEHICLLNREMLFQFPSWFSEKEFFDFAVPNIKRLKSLEIDTLIDATPINLGRDIRLIKRVADAAGINIIASTGLYYMEDPWYCSTNAEYLAEMFIGEIENGIQGTDIKAGVIKCATDIQGVTDVNLEMLKAAAIAQKATNAPIITHAYTRESKVYRKNALEQQEALIEAGARSEKTVIGHMGDTNDIDYIVKILKNGSYVGLDRFGAENINSTENRINTIIRLVDMGYADKLLLSHDASLYSDVWHSWDTPHYDKNAKRNMFIISEYVIPELKKRGVSEDDINRMMRENIRELFK